MNEANLFNLFVELRFGYKAQWSGSSMMLLHYLHNIDRVGNEASFSGDMSWPFNPEVKASKAELPLSSQILDFGFTEGYTQNLYIFPKECHWNQRKSLISALHLFKNALWVNITHSLHNEQLCSPGWGWCTPDCLDTCWDTGLHWCDIALGSLNREGYDSNATQSSGGRPLWNQPSKSINTFTFRQLIFKKVLNFLWKFTMQGYFSLHP